MKGKEKKKLERVRDTERKRGLYRSIIDVFDEDRSERKRYRGNSFGLSYKLSRLFTHLIDGTDGKVC